VEEAVFVACRRAESRGDPGPSEWLHRTLEPAYRLPEGPLRELRFQRVHAVAFRRLGLADALFAFLREHPGLFRADGPVRFGPAEGRAREQMDLHERPEENGRPVRSVLGSVLPATLADPALLAARLHRDALKVEDLLDPDFGWSPSEAESTPARRERVRVRYAAAWNAWTDGRLAGRGLPAPGTPEEAAREFAEAFVPVMGPEAAAALHESVRTASSLSHGSLLRMARTGLVDMDRPTAPGRAAPVPGSPCPFCRFPTHDWEPDAGTLPGAFVRALRDDEPGWSPEQGICAQCAGVYRSRGTAALSR
jgi:hypothetical protein